MSINKTIKFITFLYILSLSGSNCNKPSINNKQMENIQKLEPKLQSLILNEKSSNINSIKPIAKTEEGTSLYAVIIYTNNADSLQSLGIQIKSKLSEFVTARITKTQIKQCLNLDLVTYIKASEQHQPDRR